MSSGGTASGKKRDQAPGASSAARRRGEGEVGNVRAIRDSDDEDMEQDGDELVFEDPFGDEFEDEEIEEDDQQEDDDDNDERADGGDDDRMDADDDQDVDEAPKQVWRPGVDRLEEGETLEYDPSAYVMYHSLTTEWPCLSFDFLKDNLGENRQRVSFFSIFILT